MKMSIQNVEDVTKQSGLTHCHYRKDGREFEVERGAGATGDQHARAQNRIIEPQSPADQEIGSHSVPVNGGLPQEFPAHTDLWPKDLLLEAIIKSLPAW